MKAKKRERKLYMGLETFLNLHGKSLTDRDIYISLKGDPATGRERLAVERVSPKMLSVAYYFEQNGDLVPDPDVVFLIDNARKEAIPVEFQNQFYYAVADSPEEKEGLMEVAEWLVNSLAFC